MNAAPQFPASDGEFAELTNAVTPSVDTARRFPAWPFRSPAGFVTIYDYDTVLGGDFGLVLEALALEHDEAWVCVLGVEPEMPYFRDGYGMFPAFKISAPAIETGFIAGMHHQPGDDLTGALNISLNAVAMTGSSGAWAVWAQRDWEIGLLLTSEAEGPWLSVDAPWFGRDVDLSDIRSPEGWGMPISDDDLSTFWRNIRERGSGPTS